MKVLDIVRCVSLVIISVLGLVSALFRIFGKTFSNTAAIVIGVLDIAAFVAFLVSFINNSDNDDDKEWECLNG